MYHTISCLCKYLEDVLVRISDEEKEKTDIKLRLQCFSANLVKQKFEDNIFLSSFMPLRLISSIFQKKNIIW